ncbi:MAG: spiro-SPASM protein [Spirochaetia bacterium]|jgi:spiro-SPASM protein|nr:spiro-SPASM protein [Spirochaetia bacterium]
MPNRVVINIMDGGFLPRSLAGRPAVEWVLDYAGSIVPKKDIAFIGSSGGGIPGFPYTRMESATAACLIAALRELSQGYDNLVYVFGDSPFLDAGLTARMLENHAKYYAHYTFADGYPEGLAPEILAARTLPALAALCQDGPPLDRETLFALIQKDINAFDLETELSPRDLRILRASLTCGTKRGHLLCERTAESLPQGQPPASEAVLSLLEKTPEVLRTLPAFIGVQITEGCPQSCLSCPYPLFGNVGGSRRMAPGDFDLIARKAADFCGDAVIGVSLWGEPSFHPEFTRLAKSVADRPALSLLVETSGIGWKDEVVRECAAMLGPRLTWVVSLDAAGPQQYAMLRGAGWEEARARAEMLIAEFPGTAYVQALRMAENEETLESFYRAWKEKTPRLIIQKYDWFCGFLPQRKVTDLSPLDRFPCRHLRRDLCVLLDGSVPLCREDLHKSTLLGNLIADDIQTIWEKGGGFYRQHLCANHTGICGNCDEYYTWNF